MKDPNIPHPKPFYTPIANEGTLAGSGVNGKLNSTYLLEVPNKQDGLIHEVCPHNHEALPKRRPKKGAKVEEPEDPILCDHEEITDRPIPVAAPVEVPVLQRPDPEATRPLVESVA